MNQNLEEGVTRLQMSLYTGDDDTPYTTFGRNFQSNELSAIGCTDYYRLSVETMVDFTEDIFNLMESTLSIDGRRKLISVLTIEYATSKQYKVLHTDRFTYHQLNATYNKRKTNILTMLIRQLLG